MSWLSAQLRERAWHSHESRKFVSAERRLRMSFGIAEVLEIQIREVRRMPPVRITDEKKP